MLECLVCCCSNQSVSLSTLRCDECNVANNSWAHADADVTELPLLLLPVFCNCL